MIYILAALLYLIAGRGVYFLIITIEITAKFPKLKGMQVFTLLAWPVVILFMGIK
jgi:hypothetical protein